MTQYKFKLKPSKILMTMMVFLIVGGELCLIATGFPWWLTIIFAVFYGIGFYYILLHHGLMRGNNVIVKFWRSNNANSWYLVDSKSVVFEAKLLPSTVITSFLLVLHFNVEKDEDISNCRFVSVLVFKDMLHRTDFRHLLVDVITGRKGS